MLPDFLQLRNISGMKCKFFTGGLHDINLKHSAMYRLMRRLYVALQRIHLNLHKATPFESNIYVFFIILFYEGTNQKNIMLKRKLDGFHLSFFLISLPFNMFCLCNNMQPWTSFSSPLMQHLKGCCRKNAGGDVTPVVTCECWEGFKRGGWLCARALIRSVFAKLDTGSKVSLSVLHCWRAKYGGEAKDINQRVSARGALRKPQWHIVKPEWLPPSSIYQMNNRVGWWLGCFSLSVRLFCLYKFPWVTIEQNTKWCHGRLEWQGGKHAACTQCNSFSSGATENIGQK